MRRKLYSSRKVKLSGIVYIPEEEKSRIEEQKTAIITFHCSERLLRVRALIEKYQMATS